MATRTIIGVVLSLFIVTATPAAEAQTVVEETMALATPSNTLSKAVESAVEAEVARFRSPGRPHTFHAATRQATRSQTRSWARRHPGIVGALVGFGVGFGLGVVAGDDGVVSDFSGSAGGLVLGGIGAAGGAVVGALVGR